PLDPGDAVSQREVVPPGRPEGQDSKLRVRVVPPGACAIHLIHLPEQLSIFCVGIVPHLRVGHHRGEGGKLWCEVRQAVPGRRPRLTALAGPGGLASLALGDGLVSGLALAEVLEYALLLYRLEDRASVTPTVPAVLTGRQAQGQGADERAVF